VKSIFHSILQRGFISSERDEGDIVVVQYPTSMLDDAMSMGVMKQVPREKACGAIWDALVLWGAKPDSTAELDASAGHIFDKMCELQKLSLVLVENLSEVAIPAWNDR